MAWFDDLNLPGSTVTGHFAFVTADGPDEDDFPDVMLASGTVTFEPTAKAVRAGGAWVGISPVTAQVFDGELVVSEEDPRPVRILSTDADTGVDGWGWTAHFSIDDADLKPIRFRAPTEGVHLTGDDLIPITGQPVEVIEGADGASVVGGRDNGDGTLTFLLSDGSETDPVAIPPGPTGVGIASISDPDAESLVTITYTDGSTSTVRAIVGAPGDDGHTPVISWEGTALVIDGETGPDLRGAPGKDSTVPGPAPDVAWDGTRLVVGGETSPDLRGEPGAPGGKGDPGNLGSTLIYGAGRPDIVSSMAPETAATVAAAGSGAEFISTDGAGVGAWKWQKLGTAWAVTVGDTGWRELEGLSPEIPIIRIRRTGWDVLIEWPRSATSNALADRARILTAPATRSGFHLMPQTPLAIQSAVQGGQVAALIHDHTRGSWDLRITGSTAPQYLAANTRFATSDAWPTTLPGTPA